MSGAAPPARHPLWWAPNALTMARVALAPAIFASLLWAGAQPVAALANGWTTITAGLLLLAAAFDWLDGRLARAFKAESPFGRFWDPVADKLVVGAALIGGGVAAPTMVFIAPAATLIWRDMLVTWMRTRPRYATATAAPSSLAKWKTALEYAALALLFSAALLAQGVETIVEDASFVAMLVISGVALAALWVAAALSVWTGWTYIRLARRTAAASRQAIDSARSVVGSPPLDP